MPSNPTVLITGAAGFIGFHLSQKLCDAGYDVLGIDNLNDYYDVTLKDSRLEILKSRVNFNFRKLDLIDKNGLNEVFKKNKIAYVVTLDAQAGVRYSLTNPHAY